MQGCQIGLGCLGNWGRANSLIGLAGLRPQLKGWQAQYRKEKNRLFHKDLSQNVRFLIPFVNRPLELAQISRLQASNGR